jgi:hypothetical protein
MTDGQVIKKIIHDVKLSKWKDIVALGINAQQSQKIRAGLPVKFRQKTLDRLRKHYERKLSA